MTFQCQPGSSGVIICDLNAKVSHVLTMHAAAEGALPQPLQFKVGRGLESGLLEPVRLVAYE
jgi:hypothetical protein